MGLRVKQGWLGWLLPIFLLRALVPVGFMWAPFESGGLLRLCDGLNKPALPLTGAEASPSPDAAQHAHAHHDRHENNGPTAGEHSGHPGGAQQQACPFLLAGISFADGSKPVAFEIPYLSDLPPAIPVDELEDQDPILLIRIRGPPGVRA